MMTNRRNQFILLACMALAMVLSIQLTPDIDLSKQLAVDTFLTQIPKQFDGWQRVPSRTMSIDLYQKTEGERTTDNPYDDTFIQSYRNTNGHVIELAIAYGALQRQEVKIHRPDLCYYAQGYEIQSHLPETFSLVSANQKVAGQRMQVSRGDQQQLISYWMRIGDLFSQSAWQTRLYLIKQGLLGNVPDGVLVRVSSVIQSGNNSALAAEHQSFLNALLTAVHQTPVEPLLIGKI